jgi:hypothetical protein
MYPLRGTWLAEELWLGRVPLAQVCDGLLYIGPPGTQRMIRAPRDTIDERYFKELQRRSLIQWGSTAPVEALRPPNNCSVAWDRKASHSHRRVRHSVQKAYR